MWVFTLILVVLLAGPVFAGSYTVTTTPEQDAALTEMARTSGPITGQQLTSPPVNIRGAPTQTPQTLVQGFVDRALAGRVNQVKRAAACAKLTDAAQKQALGCPK